jgi:hypothetical protein
MMAGVRPAWLLRAVAIPLGAFLLVYGGYWWGARGMEPMPVPPASPRPAVARPDLVVSSTILKELVSREASLRTRGLTDWEAVNRIREWAHVNIDVATKSYLLDEDPTFRFYGRTAPEIFAAFFQDRGGVWCGGAAHALAELYRLFGYRAHTVDYGRPEAITHVVTVVDIAFGGDQKLVVQDPIFNVTYASENRSPLSYFELLGFLLRRQHGKVRILQGRRGGGDALVHPRDGLVSFRHVVDAGATPLHLLSNGVQKYRSQLSPSRFERIFGSKIRRDLRDAGHPPDLLYLHLYPLGGSDPEILEEARRLAQRYLRLR